MRVCSFPQRLCPSVAERRVAEMQCDHAVFQLFTCCVPSVYCVSALVVGHAMSALLLPNFVTRFGRCTRSFEPTLAQP